MLIIHTNIPCLIVTVFSGVDNSIVAEINGSSDPIAYFRVENKDESRDCKIEVPIEKKGLYIVRLSLPYFNAGGTMFPMPVVMNKIVAVKPEEGPTELKLYITLE